MRKYALAAAVAVGGIAGTAQADPTITPVYTQGNFAITNSSAAVFERFDATTPAAGTSVNYVPGASKNGITESVSHDVFGFNVPGPSNSVLLLGAGTSTQTAASPGTGDNYIAVEPGGTFTVSFSTAIRYFSFAVGSLDSYNSVTINFVGGGHETLTGTGITGVAGSLGSSGRVTFNAGLGPTFSSIVFQSTSSAFEISDLAAAAPEPATWGMMILGFGFVGGALRLRRRRATPALA